MRYKKHPVRGDGWTGWIHPKTSYRVQCCDCGLVHDIEFSKDIRFKVKRNNRATAASRRNR